MKMKRGYTYKLKEEIVLQPKGDLVHVEIFNQGDVEFFEVQGFRLFNLGSLQRLDDVSIYDIRIDGRSLLKHDAQQRSNYYHVMSPEGSHPCITRTIKAYGRIEAWLVAARDVPVMRYSLTLKGIAKMRVN